MNNIFTCPAHELLCTQYEYDPFDGIEGAAEHLAAITANTVEVKHLGGHETDFPRCCDMELPIAVIDMELHGGEAVMPNKLFYCFTGFFGSNLPTGAMAVFYTSETGGVGDDEFVVRFDVQTDDPEAPRFTEYLLLRSEA